MPNINSKMSDLKEEAERKIAKAKGREFKALRAEKPQKTYKDYLIAAYGKEKADKIKKFT